MKLFKIRKWQKYINHNLKKIKIILKKQKFNKRLMVTTLISLQKTIQIFIKYCRCKY